MAKHSVEVTGAWIVAIGTIVAVDAGARDLKKTGPISERQMAVGEGLQAFGAMLIGTVPTDNALEFAGIWIDGSGAATSSLAAFLQSIDPENSTRYLRLEIIGDIFQSLGALLGAVVAYEEREPAFVGDALQSAGAGFEAIGALFEVKEREREGLLIGAFGAIVQSLGAILNAILVTIEEPEMEGSDEDIV